MGQVSSAVVIDAGAGVLPERLVAALRWVFHHMESEAGLCSSHGPCIEHIARLRSARGLDPARLGLEREAPSEEEDPGWRRAILAVPPTEYEAPMLAMEQWACWSAGKHRADGLRARAALRALDGKLVTVLFALHGPRRPGPASPAGFGELGPVVPLMTKDPQWRELAAPKQAAGEDKALFDRRAAQGRQYASKLRKEAAAWVAAAHTAFAAAWEAAR